MRHVRSVPPAAATGLVAAVYEEIERDFGVLAPPVALHAPEPPLLAAAWMVLRETLVATGELERARKEAIATAVSHANSCPYCVHVHGTTLNGLVPGAALNGVVPGAGAAAPAGGADPGVRDGELRRLAAWAEGSRGGRPAPPPATRQLPEALGVAVTFHYLNRMVNVFLGPSPLPARLPSAARRTASRLFARALSESARAHREPGRSLDLLPAAPLPAVLGWAQGTPTVAGAFARAAAAVSAAADRVVPAAVRALVEAELAGWDGGHKGLGLGWLDTAVTALPRGDRAVGRLALLTACASYRVDESVVTPVRESGADDGDLVALVAWSAFTAALRAGTLLLRPPRPAAPVAEKHGRE
ncbi:carboxymuconolactone decarboxylase family protein [Streptomyces ficellus]|uniref:Carboxymuconolactone decarboxylase family protein n=1 Tax=Streptomyces ficellus TaxID=1977088 RepID=A0ABT7Z008_9ACTN|nr:carboxymuconolactone decarboxylase family protein [Streptomyces ficellus]MDN3292821.1 carboxymuconolactone decarboxylase family protein [Streptomyces ficellus]